MQRRVERITSEVLGPNARALGGWRASVMWRRLATAAVATPQSVGADRHRSRDRVYLIVELGSWLKVHGGFLRFSFLFMP